MDGYAELHSQSGGCLTASTLQINVAKLRIRKNSRRIPTALDYVHRHLTHLRLRTARRDLQSAEGADVRRGKRARRHRGPRPGSSHPSKGRMATGLLNSGVMVGCHGAPEDSRRNNPRLAGVDRWGRLARRVGSRFLPLTEKEREQKKRKEKKKGVHPLGSVLCSRLQHICSTDWTRLAVSITAMVRCRKGTPRGRLDWGSPPVASQRRRISPPISKIRASHHGE